MNFKKSITALFAAVAISSCSSDDTPQQNITRDFSDGFLVLSEGNFGTSNSNVTHIRDGFIGYENNILAPELRGDTGQSILINNGLVYIAFNNSDRIEIVDRKTFKSVATIKEGIESPRYMALANGKIYVTNWGDEEIPTDDFIAVIDPKTNKVTKEISVAEGPEKIIASEGKLYVAQKGVNNSGNTITIIDSFDDVIVGSPISVGDRPNSLQISGSEIWVLCGGEKPWGKPEENTAGGLYKIVKQAGRVVSSILFTNKDLNPQNLTLTEKNAYYTEGNNVYKFALTDTAFPSDALFKTGASNLYGFAIKENGIFVADAKDFITSGSIFVYSLGEQSGTQPTGSLIYPDAITVGIAPNGFYFDY
jgi:YVTN family beta-propeller protein